jgi:guanyl-specific ribonuclease Sa
MRRSHLWLLAIVALLGLWLWSKRSGDGELRAPQTPAVTQAVDGSVYPGFLPVEAHPVLSRIVSGSRQPFRQDGSVFQNREGRLPPQPAGYYREYTVPTPGSGDRGPRRIVTGGDPPVEFWYTADHYGSFRRFELERAQAQP